MSRLDSKTLAEEFPALAERFNAELNGFTAHEITSKNPKKVWWTCESSHSFERTVSDVTRRGLTCNYCSGRLASPENNLRIHHPLIADMFDKADNGVLATDVTVNGTKKLWWKCANEHVFEKSIAETVRTNGICFECNSLVYNYPALVMEYSSKNILGINTLSQASNRKIWWECVEGHEWESRVQHRTTRKAGCPYCSGRYATAENNIADSHPELAIQFDEEKTGSPMSSFTPSSNRNAWWKCEKGHSYECSPAKKTRPDLPYGCAYCSGYKVDDSNSLASLFPEIAKEFMEIENGISPHNVPTGRSTIYLWKCSVKSHIFKTSVADRTRRKGGCPFCSGRYPTAESNLLVTRPDHAKEFNIAKNGIRPEEVTPFANKMFWWICTKGHEWETTAGGKKGCPKCILSATSKVETMFRDEFSALPIFSVSDEIKKIAVPWRKNKMMNVDIFMETQDGRKVVVEYDGAYFHSGVASKDPAGVISRDIDKTVALLNAGYYVVRIREENSNFQLPDLNLSHVNLLQVNHRYILGLPKVSFAPAMQEIVDWLIAT